MLRVAGTGSVLFVSDASASNLYSDPSVRYRCFNLARELVRRGFRAYVIRQTEYEERSHELNGFSRYVFHRPRLTPALAEILASAPREALVADFDDLIFDVRHAEQTPAVLVRGQAADTVRHYVASQAASLQLVARATLSTVPLAQQVGCVANLPTAVIPNCVDEAFLGLARMLRLAHPHTERPYAVGYFAGTATHDRDFALVATSLAQFFEAHGDARMLLVGPVTLPPSLQAYAGRIRCLSVVPFHALPRLIAQCRKVIAPLEMTPFTRCKSGLKFFEAALLGCDVLASPIPDIERFASPLLALCFNETDWTSGLSHERKLNATDVECHLTELERVVNIGSVVSSWLQAVELKQP